MLGKSKKAAQHKKDRENNSNQNDGVVAIKPKKKGMKRKIVLKFVTKTFIKHAIYHVLGQPHLSFIDIATHIFS